MSYFFVLFMNYFMGKELYLYNFYLEKMILYEIRDVW